MGHIGQTLKKARELREIDLREISDATKINIRYLEAIESNRFDVLPGGVFNKGFIRAYANYIGLDGQAMVDDYLHEIDAGPESPSAPASASSTGLHRPSAPPQRRSVVEQRANANPVDRDRPESRIERPDPAVLHLTSLQEVPSGTEEPPRTGGDPNVLPRIAWLMVAAGVLFCILAVWRYFSDEPGPPPDAQLADGSRPVSVATPTAGRPSGQDATGEAKLAAAITPAVEREPRNEGGETNEAGEASPPGSSRDHPDPPEPLPDSPPEPPQPHSGEAAAAPPSDQPEPDLQSAREDRSDPLPEPVPEAGEDGDSKMRVRITARRATRVRVVCDGRETADRQLQRGETESLSCEHLVRLSAPDSSSIRVDINGSECNALGAPGSRLFGYVIRAEDFRSLCPGRPEVPDGPR